MSTSDHQDSGELARMLNAAQLGKIRAEIRKLSAKSDKLMLETRWYPMVLAVALFGAVAAVLMLVT